MVTGRFLTATADAWNQVGNMEHGAMTYTQLLQILSLVVRSVQVREPLWSRNYMRALPWLTNTHCQSQAIGQSLS